MRVEAEIMAVCLYGMPAIARTIGNGEKSAAHSPSGLRETSPPAP